MVVNMGRGILAPRSGSNIRDGAAEMRTLGATAASAINDTDLRVSGELAQKIGKIEAYENLVPRDEAERYGIPGPRGLVGPPSEVPGPPGPGGSIALEETDPGCFVDSEVTWLQWPQSGGLPAVWNPNTETYENPIRVDTSVGTRVFVGDVMVYGDTGWRDISNDDGLLLNGWTIRSAGRFRLRRENSVVYIQATYLNGSQATDPALYHFPQGFSPRDRNNYMHIPARDIHARPINATVTYDGQLRVELVDGGGPSIMGTFMTQQGWPTSLPGSPA